MSGNIKELGLKIYLKLIWVLLFNKIRKSKSVPYDKDEFIGKLKREVKEK